MGALTDPREIIRHTSQRHVRRMESMAFSGVRDSKTSNQIHINSPQRITKPEHVSVKENEKTTHAGEGGEWEPVYVELIIPTFIPLTRGFKGWFIPNALYPSSAGICTYTNWGLVLGWQTGIYSVIWGQCTCNTLLQTDAEQEDTALEWKLHTNQLGSGAASWSSRSFLLARVGNSADFNLGPTLICTVDMRHIHCWCGHICFSLRFYSISSHW